MSRTVKVPAAMETPRFKAERIVEIPEGQEIPLIDPTDPTHKKVQERWIVHAKIFDLSDVGQLDEYQKVWQSHGDESARVMIEKGPDFDPTKGRYVVFLKWVTYDYIAPKASGA